MKLGLLSNAALNPSVYWTTLLPPLFSGLAEQPGVRTLSPPPLASPRMGAAQGMGRAPVTAEDLRHAILDSARLAASRRHSRCLVSEPGRSPFQFRPRCVEDFTDKDRHCRDGRAPQSVICRLPRSEG